MNAVVKSAEGAVAEISPDELAATQAIVLKIADSTGLKALIPAEIARDAFKFNEFGKQAVAQVERAVLDTPEKFGLAGDLMKAFTQNIKAAEAARKSRTDKVNALVDYVTDLFRPGIKKLTAAKDALQIKLNAYHTAEENKRKADAAAAAKAAEDSALAMAAAQQAMGDNEGADKVMEDASKVIKKIETNTKVVGHGAYGSSSSAQKRWLGTVNSPAQFLAALIAMDPDKILDYVDFKTSALNALAKRMGEAKEQKQINGFSYQQDKNVRVR